MFFEQYSHEPYVAVARFWLSYAPRPELDKKRHLVGEWHERATPALAVDGDASGAPRLVRGRRLLHRRHRALRLHSLRRGRGFDLTRYPAVTTWISRVRRTPGYIALSQTW